MSLNNLLEGSPFQWCPPSVTVTMDWGAHIDTDCMGGPWPSSLKNKHINDLELTVIYWALISFSDRLRGQTVQVLSDNTTEVAYLNRQGGTVSRSLCRLAFSVWEFCIRHSIHPVALHLPGEQNLTTDAFSRGLSPFHEIEINWTYLSEVFTRWGMPDVDVFATRRNKKCNAFCCRGGADPCSLGDGLLLPWTRKHLYMFPPVPLIARVLQKLTREKPQCFLIMPWWPRQVWFPLLQTLSEGQHLPLPNAPDLICQPDQTGHHHLPVKNLKLTSWLIQP